MRATIGARWRGKQILVLERTDRPGHDREQPRATVAIEQHAAVERVAPLVGCGRLLHEEVARHPDTVDGDPTPARDLDEQHRERDRDAPPPVDHGVEEGVARVAIVLVVAPEPEHPEELLTHPVERVGRALLGQLVDPGALGVDVHGRAHAGGDAERRDVEPELRLGCAYETRESLGGLHRKRPYPAGRLRDRCIAPRTSCASRCAKPSSAGSASTNSA